MNDDYWSNLMSNNYSNNTKLERIILNTNEDKLRMWGNTIPIMQHYGMKTRVESGYDVLWIEFKTIHHLEYAEKLQKEINDCIENRLGPNTKSIPDLKTELYINTQTDNPVIKFSVSAKKYEIKIAESWNIE